MKKIKKFLCIICTLLFIIPCAFTSFSYEYESIENQYDVCSFIEMIEDEMESKGTTIDEQLSRLKVKYESLLVNVENDGERDKIQDRLNDIYRYISQYQEYKNGNLARQPITRNNGVDMAKLYFEVCGYELALELLEHAEENTKLDSYYTPENIGNITTTQTFNDVKNSTATLGTDTFEHSDSSDLYYSIHEFYYRKSQSGRLIIIEDRYDFAFIENASTPKEIVNNLVYEAQQNGEIIPFYTYIAIETDNSAQNYSETINISSVSDTRYFEDFVVLGQGEYKDYKITFSTTGNKVLQTFGRGDTMMEIFDENGDEIENDDDLGYLYNSMNSDIFYAGVEYTIRVSGISYEACELKFAVTPASGLMDANTDVFWGYDDIYAVSGYHAFTLITSTELNATHLLTYTPPVDGTYAFYLESEKDGYMYVIDPRSTELLVEYKDYDDDSGEGLNPYIEKYLEAGIPYLVIYCPYNLSSSLAVGETRVQIAMQ